MLKGLRQHHSSNMLPTYVATKHTTNELLFDTYVNNKLLNGMPSVVAFYYQLATWFTFPSSFPFLLSYVCICHVERLEAASQLKHAANLCGHKKLNKLDNRKNFQF